MGALLLSSTVEPLRGDCEKVTQTIKSNGAFTGTVTLDDLGGPGALHLVATFSAFTLSTADHFAFRVNTLDPLDGTTWVEATVAQNLAADPKAVAAVTDAVSSLFLVGRTVKVVWRFEDESADLYAGAAGPVATFTLIAIR